MLKSIDDQIIYFNNLKRESLNYCFKQNIKSYLIFTAMIQAGIWLMALINSEVLNKVNDYSLIGFLSIFAMILSIFVMITSHKTVTVDNNYKISKKEDINLYDALFFVYQKEKQVMTEQEFKDFIDLKYEKEKTLELLDAMNNKKQIYDQLKVDIEQIYAKKEKLVSRKYVLIKESRI